jgi:hypothetical protein
MILRTVAGPDALDEVFTGYDGDPHLDIEGVPDLEHVPWIDPNHPP